MSNQLQLEKGYVLIIEDEKDTREGLVRFLEPDYHVRTAENGYKGFESFYSLQLSHDTDLVVLLDIKLPDMDGMELLKRMNEINRVPNIIILTAYKDIQLAVSALQAGAYDFLGKPFSSEQLLDCVKKAYELHDYKRKFRKLKEAFVFETITFFYQLYRFYREKLKEKLKSGRDVDVYEKAASYAIEFKDIKELEKTLLKEVPPQVRKVVAENKNKPLSILVVEDEKPVREGLEILLQDNHEVKLAANGKEALALLKQNTFDLVLLDIILPDADGIEILKKIKSKQPQTDVMMTTAIDKVEVAVEAIKIGAFDYFTKPYDFDILEAKINFIKEKRYYEFALEYLVNHLREEKLSFDRRKSMLAAFREQQNKRNKSISIGDIYVFLPEVLSFTPFSDFNILNLAVPRDESLDSALGKIRRLNDEMMQTSINSYLERWKNHKTNG